MKNLAPAILTSRQARDAVSTHLLVWISARNRSTGELESIGLWTGPDHQSFSINGVPRIYYGAGAIEGFGVIRRQPGYEVRTQELRLSALAPEVITAVEAYDSRHCPVEVRLAEFNPRTDQLLAEPRVEFKGFINKADLDEEAEDEDGEGAATYVLELVSSAHALTETSTHKFSDASQRQVNAGDGIYRYVNILNADVWWGEKKIPSGEMTKARLATLANTHKIMGRSNWG